MVFIQVIIEKVPPTELQLEDIGWTKEDFKKRILEEERDIYKVDAPIHTKIFSGDNAPKYLISLPKGGD